MNNLKDYINHNRNKFDVAEPQIGHEHRFADKLGLNNENKTMKVVKLSMKVAAIAGLVVLSSIYVFTIFDKTETEIYTLSQVDPKYADVEFYYTKTTNDLMVSIDNILTKEPKIKKDILLNELSSLDSLHINLQKELKANPFDENVINAIIEYYNFKIYILNQIITQLKSIKTINTKNHDTVSM